MRRLGPAFAAMLVLSACGGDPTPIEPVANPSATNAGSSADPTSTRKPPTLPAAAKRNDETGAANFVLYWVRAFNYAARTGDSDEMRRFAAGCKVCIGYADDFESLAPTERAAGEAWTLSDVNVVRADRGYEVEATVTASEESEAYPLTFVVSSAQPYELEHIYERP